MLRAARASDIPAIQRVRASVKENRLVSTIITDEDVRTAIEDTGRGWIVEKDGEVVAFAIGNAITGNIWALFVRPEHEGRGYGRQLHDHHTDCGLQKVSDDTFKAELEAEFGVKPDWSVESFIDPVSDVRQSMRRLQLTPFIAHKEHIRGFVYDVSTGLLDEVGRDD